MVDEAERAASGAGAVASGAGAAWAFASQAAEVLFGLPIQVVLACLFASAAARTFLGTTGLLKTAWLILVYAALGAWTVPLVLHLAGLPTSVSAGVGVLISGGAQWPEGRAWVLARLKSILGHKSNE